MTYRFKTLAIAAATALAILPSNASAGEGSKGNLVAAAMKQRERSDEE